MKLAAPYKCDYCTNTKGEANHWWLRDTNARYFSLLPWDATLAEVVTGLNRLVYEHICSEQCAVKALSKWMATTPQRPTEAACE